MLRLLADVLGPLLRRAGVVGRLSRLTYNQDDVPWIAVFICRTGYCVTHSGIVYRSDDLGGTAYLHLGGHLHLSQEPESRHILAVPDMYQEDQEYLAGVCRMIYPRLGRRALPYSFEYDPDLLFDPTTGALASPVNERGFSCATFVAAVFRSTGNPLVNLPTWPTEATADDRAARAEVLRWWRASGRFHLLARANEIEPSIGARRVSPEQVIGACLMGRHRRPVSHRRCDASGRQVRAILDGRFPFPP